MKCVGKSKRKWHNESNKQLIHIIMPTFTHYHMKKLLNLQQVIIYKVEERRDSFLVKIGQPRKPTKCPYCEQNKIHSHGKGRKRKIRHGTTPANKAIWLIWQSQRFKCLSCGRTWSKPPPCSIVKGKKGYSPRAKVEALRILKTNSFGETTKQTGLSYSVLSSILDQVSTEQTLLQSIPKHGKLVFGLDEHSRRKRKLALTITLIKPKRELLGVLPKSRSYYLVKWVKSNLTLNQRKRVVEVSVDMKRSFKRTIPKLFPKAKLVIDKFHIIAYLNTTIAKTHQIRRILLPKEKKRQLPPVRGLLKCLRQSTKHWSPVEKEKIETTFSLIPEIKKLYYLKEEVRAIYKECNTKEEARKRWKKVLKELPKKPRKELSAHLEQILNYYDSYTTNAYTEGIHTKFKLIKRVSFGLKNPQIYVKKLSLGFVNIDSLVSSHTF